MDSMPKDGSSSVKRRIWSLTILDAMRDQALFGPWFAPSDSWRAWEAFLARRGGASPEVMARARASRSARGTVARVLLTATSGVKNSDPGEVLGIEVGSPA